MVIICFICLVILSIGFMGSTNLSTIILGFAVFIVNMIAAISYTAQPKAIDVYRGKTTLEITYKDSIPIDSVVVFK